MNVTATNRISRFALTTVLIAMSITLTGCGTAAKPAPRLATPSAAAGYYEDVIANFAITFPGKPTVEPIAGSQSGEVRASYSNVPDPTVPEGVIYFAGGTTASQAEVTADQLESVLFQLINRGIVLAGPEQKIELEGMPALMNDLTWTDGKPATILVAGEGHRVYQLLVIGGTSEDRQAFFHSFKLLT